MSGFFSQFTVGNRILALRIKFLELCSQTSLRKFSRLGILVLKLWVRLQLWAIFPHAPGANLMVVYTNAREQKPSWCALCLALASVWPLLLFGPCFLWLLCLFGTCFCLALASVVPCFCLALAFIWPFCKDEFNWHRTSSILRMAWKGQSLHRFLQLVRFNVSIAKSEYSPALPESTVSAFTTMSCCPSENLPRQILGKLMIHAYIEKEIQMLGQLASV